MTEVVAHGQYRVQEARLSDGKLVLVDIKPQLIDGRWIKGWHTMDQRR